MARTVSKPPLLTDLKAVQATSHPPVKVVNGREILALVRQAMAETDLKHGAAAAAAHVKESQFSSALNAVSGHHFSATWLWSMPDSTLLRFVELLIAVRQLTPAAARTARRERIKELIGLLMADSGSD